MVEWGQLLAKHLNYGLYLMLLNGNCAYNSFNA